MITRAYRTTSRIIFPTLSTYISLILSFRSIAIQYCHGLRIKTIVGELASCAEVLLYDAIVNLNVMDAWQRKKPMRLTNKVGFAVLVGYAQNFGIIDNLLHGRLHRLFELRHKIHLTHRARDPYEFNDTLLKDSEKTIEDLLKHFVLNRQRKISGRAPISPAAIVVPWKRV